jgi:hypothetical protein
VKDFLEEIAINALEKANLEPKENNALDGAVKPGLLEWLTLRLGRSDIVSFARKHLHHHDKHRAILIEFLDTTSSMECLTAESAFAEGFKAGIRFRSELEEWVGKP